MLFEKIEKDVEKNLEFIKQQLKGSQIMSEECNQLIEYHTVLKKSAQMIYGRAEFAKEVRALETNSLQRDAENNQSESEGSDDQRVGGSGLLDNNRNGKNSFTKFTLFKLTEDSL